MSRSVVLQTASRHLRYVTNNKLCSIWQRKYSCGNSFKNGLNSNNIFPKIVPSKQTVKCIYNIDHKHICKSTLQKSNLKDSLTTEQELRLIQIVSKKDNSDSNEVKTSTSKKFKLQAILEEIEYLEDHGFPLPVELKDEQWHDLLTFEHRDTRIYYFDAMALGTLNEKKKVQLFKDDQMLSGTLNFPPQFEKDIIKEGDVKKIKKLEEIKYTYESMLQNGIPVYPFMEETDLIGLMEIDHRGAIVKTINYCYDKHVSRMKEHIKKRARQSSADFKKQEYLEKNKENNHIIYGLGHNNILLRKFPRDMAMVDKNKVIREFHEWGQPLVIDLSFLKNMSMQQAKSLFYRELNFAFKFNSDAREPFVIYLTNYDPKCPKCSLIMKATNTSSNDDFPVVVTEKSYLDMFPRENLLYLSPDSKNDLLKYNADDVYIIGGLVDTSGGMSPRSIPYTLSAAKKQGIRHARLPMKRTLGITKELNVDHCVAILADYKFSKDWFYSFRWLPARVYRNRLKDQGGFTPRMEAVYMAHRQLSPMTPKGKKVDGEDICHTLSDYKVHMMHPHEYRQRYKEIVENWIKNAETDSKGMVVPYDKYVWRTKQVWQEHRLETLGLSE